MIDFLEIVLLFVICFIIKKYLKQKKCKSRCLNSIEILTENIKKLENNRQNISSCENLSKLQIIGKIANCDSVELYTYDYSEKIIKLNLNQHVIKNENCFFIKNKEDRTIPIVGSLLNIGMLNIKKDLKFYLVKDISEHYNEIYNRKVNRNLKKVYFKNILREHDYPLGFIDISYKDEKYILSVDDKEEINRIIKELYL